MEIALPLTRRKRRSLVETHDADMVPSAGPSSPTSEAARRVLWIEARMERECPQVISEAKSLAEATLDTARASPAQIWSVLWHKPLFAYTHVAIGQSYIQRLECFVANERWREWGDPSRPFVALAGPANREASFSLTPFAPPVLATLGIAKGRLFAIQGAAQALCRWGDRSRQRPSCAIFNPDIR